MKKNNLIFLLFITSILLFSCKKDSNDGKYTDPYPISINVESTVEGNEITWSAVNSSDFVEYRVWRMEIIPPFNDTISNNINDGKANIKPSLISIKKNTQITTHIDLLGAFADDFDFHFYYRIEAVLKNRSIWSRNFLSAEKKIIIDDDAIAAVKFDEKSNEAYLFSSVKSRIYVFDGTKKEIVRKINLPYKGNTSFYPFSVGIFDNKKEAYLGRGKNLYIIDLIKGQVIDSIKSISTAPIVMLRSDQSGKIYCSTSLGEFVVIDRKNSNAVFKSKPNISGYLSGLRYYDIPNENKILGFFNKKNDRRMFIFKTNDAKTSVESVEKEINYPDNVNNEEDIGLYFLKNNSFVFSKALYVFDKNLTNLGQIDKQHGSNYYLTDSQSANQADTYFTALFTGVPLSCQTKVVKWKYPNIVTKEIFINNYCSVGLFPQKKITWIVLNDITYEKFTIKKFSN
jgi:hypothetical protein